MKAPTATPVPESLAILRDEALACAMQGDLTAALEISQRACSLAATLDDGAWLDLAVCNRAAYAIELGRGAHEVAPLREIVGRAAHAPSGWLSAYSLARHYERTKDFKKSFFYGCIARDRAREAANAEWLANSRNLLGNALLGLSRIPEASVEYEAALTSPELLDGIETRPATVVYLFNLGYCHVLGARLHEGRRLLLRGLRLARRLGTTLYEVQCRLDLAFTHLERNRPGAALRHATLALALAREEGEGEKIKNALYLLGEAATLAGSPEQARQHFARLQGEFFPEQPYLVDFLLSVDVRRMINLHA